MTATCSWAIPRDQLHSRFLQLVPRIETHAKVSFRHIKCAFKKADLVAETVAIAWKWFVRLTEKGKDAAQFVSTLASLAVRAVRSGRRLTGQEKAKDVMNGMTQQRHAFKVESLPVSTCAPLETLYSVPLGQEQQDAFEERLQDNMQTPVPDQAAFRIDWPGFIQSLTRRDRKLAEFLSMGHTNKQAATTFKLSPGRVSQLRSQWCREWYALHGEKAPFEDRTARGRVGVS